MPEATPPPQAAAQTGTNADTAPQATPATSSGPQPGAAADKVAATLETPAGTAPAPTPEAPKPEEDGRVRILAEAKRLAAKGRQAEENAKRLVAQAKDDAEAAARYRALDKMRVDDPLGFIEAIGMDFQALSKAWLAKSTGQGKTPQQLVDEAVNVKLEAERKQQAEAAAAADAKRKAELEDQTLQGTKAEFIRMVKATPETYEVASKMPPSDVADKAWTAMSIEFNNTKRVMPFTEALAGVEYLYKKQQLAISFGIDVPAGTPSEKLAEIWKTRFTYKAEQEAEAKKKAAAAEAEKTKARGGAAPRPVVETEAEVVSNRPPPRRRPLNVYEIANELVASKNARHDN